MSKEHVFEVVKKVIMEVLPDMDPEQISIEGNLRELGANSIDRMEIVTMSMEELDLKISLMSFAKVSDIEGLVNVLAENHVAAGE